MPGTSAGKPLNHPRRDRAVTLACRSAAVDTGILNETATTAPEEVIAVMETGRRNVARALEGKWVVQRIRGPNHLVNCVVSG